MKLGRVLAVVPARGGSKGLPRKNLALIDGHPLVGHAIRAARACPLLTRIVLSSEDEAVCEVAREYGADVPFIRPSDLAGDEAKSIDVTLHALEFVEQEEGRSYDAVCLLEPTSPLRTSEDVTAAVKLLSDSGADAVISVYRIETPHPFKTLEIVDGHLRPFLPQWRPNLLRQELPPVYAVNGAVYCVRRAALTRDRSFWGQCAAPYVMPGIRSINIDTEIDLEFAEFLLKKQRQRTNAG